LMSDSRGDGLIRRVNMADSEQDPTSAERRF
jgi:hypothetical protein